MRPYLPSVLATAVLLAGCQAAPPPPPPPPPVPTAPTAPSTPPAKAADATEMRDAIQQPIDKAKATEDAVLKAAEEQRKRDEDAGG